MRLIAALIFGAASLAAQNLPRLEIRAPQRMAHFARLHPSLLSPYFFTSNACTTTATGSLWSSAAHWTNCGGTTPQPGDTATIANNTTLDVAATVGTSPPGAPTTVLTVSATGGGSTGGSLAAATYSLIYTQVDTNGVESLPLNVYSQTSVTVASGNIPRVTFPARPTGIASYNIYATNSGTNNATRYLQATGITATTYDWNAAYATTTALNSMNMGGVFVNSGVTLTFSATLTLKGNIQLAGGNLAFNAGSGLTFNNASAVYNGAYQIATTYFATVSTITATGTTGFHVTIQTSAAPNAFMSYWSGGSYGVKWTVSFVDFINIGDSTNPAAVVGDNTGGSYVQTFDHCSWDANSGQVKWVVQMASGSGYWMTSNKFNQTSVGPVDLRTTGSTTTQTRLFDGNSFSASTTIAAQLYATKGTFTNNFFGQAPVVNSSGNAWTSWNNNFIRATTSGATTYSGWTPSSSASNTYFYVDSQNGNPHIIVGIQSSETFDGFVLEYAGPYVTDGGDGFYTGSVVTGVTIQNTLILPSAADANPSSNLGNFGSGSSVSFYHNTFSFAGEGGLAIGDSPAGAGVYPNFKSNLGWAPNGTVCTASQNCRLVYTKAGSITAVQNVLTGGNAVNNYSWNAATGYARGTQYPGVAGVGYDAYCSVAPGQSDAWATGGTGPNFVDSSRNLAKWAVARGSTAGTTALKVADAYTYLAADPTLIASSLLPYVRGGFAPQNTALHGTAHDSGDIGAVAWQAAPYSPMILQPIVW